MTAQVARRAPPQERRAQLIKLIHVAKRELRLTEPDYRALLQASGGASSTADMDVAALDKVVKRMRHSGFRVRHKTVEGASAAERRPDRVHDTRDQARKVRALWLFLHCLGVVREPSERALGAYVKRIAGVDDLHWAHGESMTRLIETLKKWTMRYLPAENARLRDTAQAFHEAGQLGAAQLSWVRAAEERMRGEVTFDNQWAAWSLWCRALGREVPPQLLDAPDVSPDPHLPEGRA